jgi:DNA-binding CsgD family transcriptional regulator/tetratricopeptide (TPR) repeat protein
MLETVHGFALEQLAASGEDAVIRSAHAHAFFALGEQGRLAAFREDGSRTFARLRAERANVRAALEWFASTGDSPSLLRLSGSLGWFWGIFGSYHEGKQWLERALALGQSAPDEDRAWALYGLGAMNSCLDELPEALSCANRAVELFRASDDLQGLALGLRLCGIIETEQDAPARARNRLEETLRTIDRMEDGDWVAPFASTVLGDLGNAALMTGEFDQAERWFLEAIDRLRMAGITPGTTHFMTCETLAGLGHVARARGQRALALRWYQDCLRHASALGYAWAIDQALAGVAGSLAAAGRWELAARFFGAEDSFCASQGFTSEKLGVHWQRALSLPEPWLRADQPFGQMTVISETVRRQQRTPPPAIPDPAEADRLWAVGRATPIDEAIRAALDLDVEGDRSLRPTSVADQADHEERNSSAVRFTKRQTEVLELVAEGRTDSQIAAALFISARTVEGHVRDVLAKLQVPSRTAAVSLAQRLGLI